MKKGTPRELKYTKRYGQLVAAHSINDFYALLVELLTNADDSYGDQFAKGQIPQDGGTVLLEVKPRRGAGRSVIRVSDRAGGFRNLLEKLENVGDRQSESSTRGFMGRGLKDCAALGHVTVETIVDGFMEKAEIDPTFKLIPYQPSHRKGDKATKEDRARLGIRRGNGTVVEVSLNESVKLKQLDTLRRELPWHYTFRDIMREGGPSKVLLRYSGGDAEPLHWVGPDAECVHDREHEVPGYPGRRFRFRLWRASEPLGVPADPRFRRTGILVKGRRGIHGCSFLDSALERDPGAERYFGRIECPDIDALAEEYDDRRQAGQPHSEDNPTFLLDPNRKDGLDPGHPFVEQLFREPIEVLKQQFEIERRERESRRVKVEAKETTDRLKRLARQASRFMKEKLEGLGSPAPGDVVNDKSFNERGVGVSPVFTKIPVASRKTYFVKVNNEKLDLPPGTVVQVGFSKAAGSAVALVGSPTDLEVDPVDPSLLRGSFTLEGLAVSSRVQVGCTVDGLLPVFVELQVIPAEPVDLKIENDFAFHRAKYSVRQGSRRTLLVRARFKKGDVERPTIGLADPKVAVIRNRPEFESVPGTTYYEAAVILEGRKPQGSTVVTAEADGRLAECRLRIVEKEEPSVDLKFELVTHDLGTNFRAVWDRKEPNKLLITTRHDSVSRYLGSEAKGFPGQTGEPFRVLLAELVSDNVCRRIVEEHARAQPHEFDSDKLYLLHNRLMKEFTPIAHKVQLPSPTAGPV